MQLLNGSACSKVVILALMTFVLVSSPDQCEATTCYKCNGPCKDANAKTEECTGDLPCNVYTITQADGNVIQERGCNVGACEEVKFGLDAGCKEATWPDIKPCGASFMEGYRLKYCVCAGEKCNNDAFAAGSGGGGEGGGDGGGGDSSKASSLNWTAVEAVLMMASILIAIGGL